MAATPPLRIRHIFGLPNCSPFAEAHVASPGRVERTSRAASFLSARREEPSRFTGRTGGREETGGENSGFRVVRLRTATASCRSKPHDSNQQNLPILPPSLRNLRDSKRETRERMARNRPQCGARTVLPGDDTEVSAIRAAAWQLIPLPPKDAQPSAGGTSSSSRSCWPSASGVNGLWMNAAAAFSVVESTICRSV